jgi:outer membrane protein
MTLALALVVLGLQGSVLTLDEAVRTAETHQPQMHQARAERDAADARTDQALAPLLPQVHAGATYQRTTANRVLRVGTDPRMVAAQPPPRHDLWNFFRFELTATQLVYDFGQSTGKLSAGKAAAKAQAETERATRLSVIAGARLAFFAALAHKELVSVARQAVDNQKRHLEQVEGFVEAKTRPQIDLAQARLDQANAEVQLIQAENAYDTAKAELNQAMGVEQGTDYDLADASIPPVPGEEGPTDALVTQALRTRPEFVSLTEQARAEEARVRSAFGAYAPTLSVGAGATEAGQDLAQLRWNYYGLVTISWPLFDGMGTPARVREARANLAVVQARTGALRHQVRLDIERARLALRAARSTLNAAGRALDNADERLRLAEGRYEAGVGNAIELGDALLARSAAAAQKIQADYLLSAARAQLRQALGRD